MTKQRMVVNEHDSRAPDGRGGWPGWVPVGTRNYLAHVEGGQTIRQLAKAADVHPSTILRRVRKVESLRDDPLLEAALRRITEREASRGDSGRDPLLGLAAPALRQLNDETTVLLVSRDMEKAVILRTGSDGELRRLSVLDRTVAEELALRRWITAIDPDGRMQRYRITHAGRCALRSGAIVPRRIGFSEEQVGFAMPPEGPIEDDRLHHMRSELIETPLMALSRRRDEKGEPFLSRDQVAAADRLREDFELSQREAQGPIDWDHYLEELLVTTKAERGAAGRGVPSADARLRRALRDLGPGMADVALRCCCLLEGLETVERRLSWSARSGKIVLRIALERLHQHYRAEDARVTPLIG